MKKRRIVIASILKPVDDTRMLEKMAVTLGDSGKYDVFIIGYPSKPIHGYTNIVLLPLLPFPRLSLRRLVAPWKVFGMIHKVNPDIVIVNTHELLTVAILNRILFGTRIIYDIRENYFRNILYTEAFGRLLRPFLAAYVRLKEVMASPWIKLFLLAEQGYQNEVKFARPHLVIENKAAISRPPVRQRHPGKIRLLFSGTLAESTGVFQAIQLARKLHQVEPAITLDLIGYCAKPGVLQKIREAIESYSFIQLLGGDRLVPHHDIIGAITNADFGLVCYPVSRQNENSIPTKVYEYLASRLPILLQQHPPWVALCKRWDACIPLDFESVDPAWLLQQMQQTFYPTAPEEVTWEPEGLKLLAALDNIFA